MTKKYIGAGAKKERRWSMRKPVSASAVLNCGKSGLVSGRAENISMGGIFVETRSETFLPEGFALQVHVMLPTGGEMNACKFGARVVYTTKDGVGLMFHRVDPALCRRLSQFLYASKAGPPK